MANKKNSQEKNRKTSGMSQGARQYQTERAYQKLTEDMKKMGGDMEAAGSGYKAQYTPKNAARESDAYDRLQADSRRIDEEKQQQQQRIAKSKKKEIEKLAEAALKLSRYPRMDKEKKQKINQMTTALQKAAARSYKSDGKNWGLAGTGSVFDPIGTTEKRRAFEAGLDQELLRSHLERLDGERQRRRAKERAEDVQQYAEKYFPEKLKSGEAFTDDDFFAAYDGAQTAEEADELARGWQLYKSRLQDRNTVAGIRLAQRKNKAVAQKPETARDAMLGESPEERRQPCTRPPARRTGRSAPPLTVRGHRSGLRRSPG